MYIANQNYQKQLNHSKDVRDHSLKLCNRTVEHVKKACESVNILYYQKKLDQLEKAGQNLPRSILSFLELFSGGSGECNDTPANIFRKCTFHVETMYAQEKVKASMEHVELMHSIEHNLYSDPRINHGLVAKSGKEYVRKIYKKKLLTLR